VLEPIKPLPSELVINKTTYSAFTSTGIDQTLRNMGITDLVFCGVGTNVCVESTARDASDRGYRCVMVEDACATYIEELHDATLLAFGLWFGRVKSADEVIKELEQGMRKGGL
jgi:nicotinamidase-related amidase